MPHAMQSTTGQYLTKRYSPCRSIHRALATIKPTSPISAEFGIIYNFSLFPDDKTIDSKVSFKATYTVTLLPDPPEYEFNLDPNLVPNATAIAIWFVIALGVCAGVVSVSGVGLIAVLCGLSATNFIYPVLGTEFDVEE